MPYNVKLPKVSGPSEAEKKLEQLTRELEKEFDEKEKQEYFGNAASCFLKWLFFAFAAAANL